MPTISDSAAMVGLVQTSSTLPVLLFSLVSGAVADNVDRRRVMLAAQVFMTLVSAILAAYAWMGLVTPWLLLGLTFLIGSGIAFNNPAWQATVGDIVSREDIDSAVLLDSASFNVTRSVGPALGGIIVTAACAAAAFTINAVSYLGLIRVIWRWRNQKPHSRLPPEALRAAMGTGLRYVALSPNILRVLLRGFLFGLTTVVVLALLPLVARRIIGGNALTYGILLCAFGIGAVIGAAVSRRLRQHIGNEPLVRCMFFAYSLAALVIVLVPDVMITSGALMIADGAWVIALSLLNTTVQLSAPRWVLGRALSLYQMALFGGTR